MLDIGGRQVFFFPLWLWRRLLLAGIVRFLTLCHGLPSAIVNTEKNKFVQYKFFWKSKASSMVWFVVLTTIYNRINSNDLLLYVQCAVLVWKLELISFYTVLQWIIVGMSHLVFWRVLALSCWFALVSSRYVRWFAFEKKCYLVEVPSLCYNLVFVAAKKCKTIQWLSFKPIFCMR